MDNLKLELLIYGMLFGMLIGIVPAIYGATKKKPSIGILGFIACAFFGAIGGLLLAVPFAAIFVGIIAKGQKKENVLATHKKCIHCAEEILLEAKICKYCNREQV